MAIMLIWRMYPQCGVHKHIHTHTHMYIKRAKKALMCCMCVWCVLATQILLTLSPNIECSKHTFFFSSLNSYYKCTRVFTSLSCYAVINSQSKRFFELNCKQKKPHLHKLATSSSLICTLAHTFFRCKMLRTHWKL